MNRSAGILLYRRTADDGLQVWIAHMGGPFWAGKDDRAWSIPKGLVDETDDGDELRTARREFLEEIGTPAPDAEYEKLGEFRQSSGKTVIAFAAEAEFSPAAIVSNTFSLEWPPRSGRLQEFPEIDDARWFPADVARAKVVAGQVAVLDALVAHLARRN
ncbi:NUDIX domain-containing protein [Diaminobutyricibacter tongyongensis]|uniref:NUDIX domain-containing protein n=1 Tax=Leifsonia tongyongensis TaxID=1268043 RepID=A0A6L9XYC2_9MICO|nr:NUDIX domain-containing protein [Diaminobutyricibacter tongyongensis]NEN06431.1 NUDIX domain-containing protein [Diaminobutyricibacter tongyongensis]